MALTALARRPESKSQPLAGRNAGGSQRSVLAAAGLGFLSLLGAIIRNTKHRREERDSDDWLQATLASIGDGVITTDVHGVVTFLNPMAERLTGWSLENARGRAIEDVFHIVNQKTREPVENPVVKVLTHGCVIGLANHTVHLEFPRWPAIREN